MKARRWFTIAAVLVALLALLVVSGFLQELHMSMGFGFLARNLSPTTSEPLLGVEPVTMLIFGIKAAVIIARVLQGRSHNPHHACLEGIYHQRELHELQQDVMRNKFNNLHNIHNDLNNFGGLF
ncbi:MAG: hypothetical protein HC884_04060 [Chloroflexaceae bacterium]|nr:hypothetical protein [Chloroflexaceae bacterium]